MFQRIWTTSAGASALPVASAVTRTGKGWLEVMEIPSLPLEWAVILILQRASKASGDSERSIEAARKPSTRREAPPSPLVWESRWKVCKPAGSVKSVKGFGVSFYPLSDNR